MDEFDDDVVTETSASEDLREFKLVIRSPRPMTIGDIVLELEYQLNEMTNAEAKLREAGEYLH